MKKANLYLKYAFRQIFRAKQRTIFVLLSIALGVAIIVALRSIGWMIQDTFTQNLQAFNKGDLVVTSPTWYQAFSSVENVDTELVADGENPFGTTTFSPQGIKRLQAWAEKNQYTISFASRNQPPAFVYANNESEALVSAPLYFVDEAQYPFYTVTKFVAGDYATLADALAGDDTVVISESLADRLSVSVGDSIHVAGSTRPFRVTAVAADENEGGLSGAMLLVGFLYLPNRVGISDFDTASDTAFIQLHGDVPLAQPEKELQEELPGFPIFTTTTLLENVQNTTDVITRLVTALGLFSLLIGGIAVYNTVTVIVRSRTIDVGVLKAVGLSNQQVAVIFLTEFALYGLVGSCLGAVLGIGLTQLLQHLVELLFQQTLVFAVYPEAVGVGCVLGIFITVLFSILPILRIGLVRPTVVLNPSLLQKTTLPSKTYWSVLLVGILLVGFILGQILQSFVLGFVLTISLAGGLSFAVWLLSLVIRFVGHIPARQNPYLLLSQRSMTANQSRTTSTLLALTIGIFCLGLVLLLAQSAIDALNAVVAEQYGGDVVVLVDTDEASKAVAGTLPTLEGILSYKQTINFAGRIVAINDDQNMDALFVDAYLNGLNQFSRPNQQVIDEEGQIISPYKQFDPVAFQLRSVTEQFTLEQTEETTPPYPLVSGSYDLFDQHSSIIIQAGSATEWLGLAVGDTVTFAWENGCQHKMTIVGIIGKPSSPLAPRTEYIQVNGLISTAGATSEIQPSRISYTLTTEQAQKQDIVLSLSALSNVTVLELAQVNSLTTQLIQQLAFVPLVVALLSLFASGVTMANTITLTTLERRREMDLMKVIGLHSTHLLRVLFVENGIISLLGGGIGVGLSLAGLLLLNLAAGNKNLSPGQLILTVVGLMGIAISVSLGATFVVGWPAAHRKIRL